MPRLIETESDRKRLHTFIDKQALPFTADIKGGKLRTLSQNATQWLWANEAAEHHGDRTAADVQSEWKLAFGVPILCSDAEFAETWERLAGALSYEQQLDLMRVYPVTRVMTSKQLSTYLDQISRHCAQEGIRLTHPDDRMAAA